MGALGEKFRERRGEGGGMRRGGEGSGTGEEEGEWRKGRGREEGGRREWGRWDDYKEVL